MDFRGQTSTGGFLLYKYRAGVGRQAFSKCLTYIRQMAIKTPCHTSVYFWDKVIDEYKWNYELMSMSGAMTMVHWVMYSFENKKNVRRINGLYLSRYYMSKARGGLLRTIWSSQRNIKGRIRLWKIEGMA